MYTSVKTEDVAGGSYELTRPLAAGFLLAGALAATAPRLPQLVKFTSLQFDMLYYLYSMLYMKYLTLRKKHGNT